MRRLLAALALLCTACPSIPECTRAATPANVQFTLWADQDPDDDGFETLIGRAHTNNLVLDLPPLLADHVQGRVFVLHAKDNDGLMPDLALIMRFSDSKIGTKTSHATGD